MAVFSTLFSPLFQGLMVLVSDTKLQTREFESRRDAIRPGKRIALTLGQPTASSVQAANVQVYFLRKEAKSSLYFLSKSLKRYCLATDYQTFIDFYGN